MIQSRQPQRSNRWPLILALTVVTMLSAVIISEYNNPNPTVWVVWGEYRNDEGTYTAMMIARTDGTVGPGCEETHDGNAFVRCLESIPLIKFWQHWLPEEKPHENGP